MYLRKHSRKVIILGIAAFLLFGMVISFFFRAQYTEGEIELPEHLTSAKILAHIANNFEQLGDADSPFSTSAGFGTMRVLNYANDSGLSIMLTLEADACPEDVLAAEHKWQGRYLAASDLMTAITGSGKYTLFFTCSQGPLVLVIAQENAARTGTSPLEEALALIEGIIGTP